MVANVEAGDRRVQFVGIKAYKKAGGHILRDLFQPEHDGYLTDVAVLDRLVIEKLEAEPEAIRAEGWKWVITTPTIGLTITNRPSEYVVNIRDGGDATAYLTDDLDDALDHGPRRRCRIARAKFAVDGGGAPPKMAQAEQ